MSQRAALRIEVVGEIPIAHASGEIDASNADRIGAQLIELLPNHGVGVVVDLTATSYLDSSAIRVLFDVASRLRRRQQSLRLVVEPESFAAEVLAAVAIEEAASVHRTVEDAVDALRAAS